VICDRALTLGHEASASAIDARLIEAAAEATHVTPAASAARRIVRAVAAGTVLTLLMLVGALGAVVVFQYRVALIVRQWEAVPPPPRGPAPRVLPPLPPLPPPSQV